jgi:hypothetical protein
MLYLVKVGRATRRGGFESMLSFGVSSENTRDEVRNHFINRYSGMDVQASDVETLDIQAEEAAIQRDKSYLKDIPVALAGDEKSIQEEIGNLFEKIEKLKTTLHDSIKGRFFRLGYVSRYVVSGPNILLETTRHGTVIKHLTIHGKAFIEKAGEGKEIGLENSPGEEK